MGSLRRVGNWWFWIDILKFQSAASHNLAYFRQPKSSKMNHELLKTLIFWCGVGHIGLCFVGLLIPKFLNWKKALEPVPPLIRQIFWTYAGYILAINFWFGIVSIFGADELLGGSFLAKSITFFIGFYWLARIFIQFFYFDTTDAPKGLFFKFGEIGLVVLFVGFTLVYFTAFFQNLGWI